MSKLIELYSQVSVPYCISHYTPKEMFCKRTIKKTISHEWKRRDHNQYQGNTNDFKNLFWAIICQQIRQSGSNGYIPGDLQLLKTESGRNRHISGKSLSTETGRNRKPEQAYNQGGNEAVIKTF